MKCIEHYGVNCIICGFNFEEIYGSVGKEFIHVHHLIELREINEQYEVDPIEDLRPVCPNCHAILHKRKPAYSIKEMKSIIRKRMATNWFYHICLGMNMLSCLEFVRD